MPYKAHHPQVTPKSQKQALSAGQKKFNTLIKKIEKQRQLLESWQAAIPVYRHRWEIECKPRIERYRELNIDLMHLLDRVTDRLKLTKAQQQTLECEICERIEALINDDNRESLKALYHKHSGRDFDYDQQMENELLKDSLEQVFGYKLADDVDLNSPEAIAQHIFEQAEQAQDAKHRKKPGKKTAKQTRLEEENAQASKSVREVYRKLASALHPDRETDANERARKTDLMQQVNRAYAERNLLDLLRLQLTIEQIDTHDISALAETQLRHYNRVLSEQLAELQDEVFDQEMALKIQLQLDPMESIALADLEGVYTEQAQAISESILLLEEQLTYLEEPKFLKMWLKERKKDRDEDALFDEFDDDFFR